MKIKFGFKMIVAPLRSAEKKLCLLRLQLLPILYWVLGYGYLFAFRCINYITFNRLQQIRFLSSSSLPTNFQNSKMFINSTVDNIVFTNGKSVMVLPSLVNKKNCG